MIDQEALIRQLKIAMITGEPNAIIQWFESKVWKKIKISTCDVINDNGSEIIYHTTYEVLFYYNKDMQCFRVNIELWKELREWFGLNYPKFSEVIKLLMESYLNHPIPAPSRMHPRLRNKIEELLPCHYNITKWDTSVASV